MVKAAGCRPAIRRFKSCPRLQVEYMKILFIHANYVNYKVKRKTKLAEEIDEKGKTGSMHDPLISFICVEGTDENNGNVKGLAKRTFEEIENIASKIKTQNIVLFPFAHLSDNLASPNFAVSTLTEVKSKLEASDFRTLRVPFGWYKEFEFRSKGHPLAVLSRSVSISS